MEDPIIEKIVQQVKSQGKFDQFRKECISDVDTKPAYQNLRQRVGGSVSTFLSSHQWAQDLNKKQLRDNLRKYIQNSAFLEAGVERIVDQVVNPKIGPVFLPQVEDVVYDCLGVNKPGSLAKSSPPVTKVTKHTECTTTMSDNVIKIKPQTVKEINSRMDLEPASPSSELSSPCKASGSKTDLDQSVEEEEEASPPFEPHTDAYYDSAEYSSLQGESIEINGVNSSDDAPIAETSEKTVNQDEPKNLNPVNTISSPHCDEDAPPCKESGSNSNKSRTNQKVSKSVSFEHNLNKKTDVCRELPLDEGICAPDIDNTECETHNSETKKKHKHSSRKTETKANESKHVSKEHHSHHKHNDKRVSNHSSKSSKHDKHLESNKSNHKQVNLKKDESDYQKSKIKSKDESKTRSKIKESHSSSKSSKKVESESSRKEHHHRSRKTSKKDDHCISEKYSSPSDNTVKVSKKSTERHHISKTKHPKQKCKGNDKHSKRRRSNDRDSDEQNGGSTITDSSSKPFLSATTNTSDKECSSPNSSENIVTDSAGNIFRVSNSQSSDGKKRKVKFRKMKSKKNTYLYELKKKKQARKNLEIIRKRRELLAIRRNYTRTYIKKLVFISKDGVKNGLEKINSFIDVGVQSDFSSDTKPAIENDDAITISDESACDTKISLQNHSGSQNQFTQTGDSFHQDDPQTHVDITDKNTKRKYQKKAQSENSARFKLIEIVDQENEPDYLSANTKTETGEYPLITIASSDDASIITLNTDTDSDIVPSRKVHIKKSKRSYEANKSEQPKKKQKNEEGSKNDSNDERIRKVIITKIKSNKVKGDRQNKVLKVINQDVQTGSSKVEKELKNNNCSTEDEWTVSQGNYVDSEEYSPSKPVKLHTNLVNVALQDLLMESGLTSAYSKEPEAPSKPKLNKRKTSTESNKIKPSDKLAHQHYDKSDLYKPRLQFTNSSKRSRRQDANANHEEACGR